VAGRLKIGNEAAINEATALSNEISKMLTSFIQKLGSKPKAKS
jgi:hypothetical protein